MITEYQNKYNSGEVAHLAYQGWTYGIDVFKHNVQEIISEKNSTEKQQLRERVYFPTEIFSDTEIQGRR